jgi:magnesium-protoporphyrin IX monomethyl ester (oxidative) cyclase
MKKTKVLLIFPPFTVSSSDYPTPDPPLGLAYIAAVLEKYQYPVKILDALALGIEQAKKKKGDLSKVGLSKRQIKKVIADYQPAIVGISCAYTAHAPDAHEVAAWVKEVDPKILVVFGGAHATACAPLVLKDKNVDIVVLGEGELAFLELVDFWERKKDFSQVQSTAQRRKDKIIINPRHEFITNLDDLPDPAWHLLPMDIYLKRQIKTREFSMRTPRTNIITSRGCPGNCVFCSIHAIWGHRWRPRSPEKVVAEMEHLVKTYGVREFYVLDDNISIKRDRLIKICDLIRKKGLDIKWAAPNGVALWTLDKKVLEKMKQSGFYRITFGIESGCPRILKFIRKPMVLKRAEEIIDISNRLGLWTHSTFIIGFPDETKEEIEETINWTINSGLDFVSFYIATPYPGTDLHEEFVKNGLLKKGEEERMHYSSISISGYDTLHFKKEKLNQIRDEAYGRFFTSQMKRYLLNPFCSLPHITRKIKTPEEFLYFLKLLNNAFGMRLKSIITGRFQSHYK